MVNTPIEIELSLEESYIGSAYSPQVDINETESGHEIEITYKAPEGLTPKSFEVPDKDWQEAEDARVSAESARAQAETARVQAESGRVSAEDARVSAEAARVQAESSRVTEWQTMSHDMQEATADATHAADETNAFLQDAMGNEAQRVSAEQARIASEAARESAERRRRADETARAEAESEREINESGRIAAERARVNAETARVQAETTRAASWDTLSSNITSATQFANQAASDASSAASTAMQATTDTRQATSAADAAAANARQATANANQATSNANQATQAATQATEHADQATTNANQAAQSATTAASDANAATESASAAASAANAAAVTASQEAEGASAAAELANAATTAATEATEAATDATTVATQAASTANDAAERAEDAASNASTAASQADAATTAANAATTAASTATTQATQATQAANTAASAASQAASDATEAAGMARRASAATWLSGNVPIGSIAEGELLTASDVYAAPPRDVGVHGKSEQVQTTGKNLLSDVEGDWQKLLIPDVATRWVYFIPVDANTAYTYSRSTVSSTIGLLWGWCDDLSFTGYEAVQTLTNLRQWTATNTTHAYLVVSCEATGNTITAAQLVTYIECFCCQIEKASARTDYEPYSGSIASPSPSWSQPIESVDTLTLELHGKNLWNEEWEVGSINDATGVNYNVTDTIRSKYIKVQGNTQYCCGQVRDGGVYRFYFYDDDKKYIGFVSSSTFTTPSNVRYVRFRTYVAYGTTYKNDIQLELGSTATDYEPYVGSTVPIPLQGHKLRSLPDGTRDELRLTYQGPSETEGMGTFGVELVQRIDTTVLDGSENWNSGASYNGNVGTNRFVNIAGMRNTGGMTNNDTLLSEEVMHTGSYIWSNPDANIWKCVRFNGQAHIVFDNATVGITSETTDRTALIKAWLAENPITVHYPMLTPATHDLGTVDLPVLPAPDLNAWADGGSVQPTIDMGYEQDINIVIANIGAALADLATS